MVNLHRHFSVGDPQGLTCSCKSPQVVWVCVIDDKARFLCAPCEKAEVAEIRATRGR